MTWTSGFTAWMVGQMACTNVQVIRSSVPAVGTIDKIIWQLYQMMWTSVQTTWPLSRMSLENIQMT